MFGPRSCFGRECSHKKVNYPVVPIVISQAKKSLLYLCKIYVGTNVCWTPLVEQDLISESRRPSITNNLRFSNAELCLLLKENLFRFVRERLLNINRFFRRRKQTNFVFACSRLWNRNFFSSSSHPTNLHIPYFLLWSVLEWHWRNGNLAVSLVVWHTKIYWNNHLARALFCLCTAVYFYSRN